MDNEIEELRRRVTALERWVAETERGIATLPDALRKAFEADGTQGGDARDPG